MPLTSSCGRVLTRRPAQVTMSTHDHNALYQSILADPTDDAARLVFADLLDETGDADRAEFIRAQVRLAGMNEWDEGYTELRLRAGRLAREHGERWVKPPGTRRPGKYPFSSDDLVRGFVGRVNVTPELTPAAARRSFAPHPITEARVTVSDEIGSPDSLLWRLTLDALHGLRSLTLAPLYGCPPATMALACRLLAGAECRRDLTHLEFKGDPSLEGLEAIITSPHLRRLQSLGVYRDGGDDHARLMAAKMHLPALRRLGIGGRELTPAGAEALGRAGWFRELTDLGLYGPEGLGDRGVKNLFARPLPALRSLDLNYCGLTVASLPTLAGRKLPGLVDLALSERSRLEPEDALPALTSGPQGLLSLSLYGAPMSPATAAKFFGGRALRSLRRLELASAFLSEEAVAALVRSPLPATLRVLDLSVDIEADGPARALCAGPEWPALAKLTLGGRLTGDALWALFERPRFARLVSLTAKVKEGAMFLKRLARSPGAARLRELDLDVHLTSAAACVLADSPHLGGIDRLHLAKGRADKASCQRLVDRFGTRAEIRGFNARF